MELLMRNIPMCRRVKQAGAQITLDEDLNVPDVKPDVERIIQSRERLVIEHMRAESGKLLLDGALKVRILYMDDTKERQICRLDTKLPFEEAIAMEGLEPGEAVRVRHETEDLNVSLINSRKLAIRALVSFEASVDEIYDLSAAVEVRQGLENRGDPAGTPREKTGAGKEAGSEELWRKAETGGESASEALQGSYGAERDGRKTLQICEKRQKLEFLQLEVQNKDILRLKEDVQLPSSKPDIREVLWEDAQLRGCRIHLEEGKLMVRGNLFLFVLYRAEDENESLQWMEQTIPVEGGITCNGCEAGLVPDIEVALSGEELSVKEDADGELRVFHLEGVLDLNICLYGTDRAEILSDVFSPQMELEPVTAEEAYETLVVRNESRCKAQGKIRIQSAKPRILQICHSSGTVRIDQTEILTASGEAAWEEAKGGTDRSGDSYPFGGIRIEGALPVSILYISSDDSMPFAVLEGTIPFSHVAEAQGIDAGCRFTLSASLDQLSATMSDSEEIEIRASVSLNLLAVRQGTVRCIHEIREKAYDPERLEAVPGMIGYIVQEGETLWDIAKEYFQTPQEIAQMNALASEQVKAGDRLILMRSGNL